MNEEATTEVVERTAMTWEYAHEDAPLLHRDLSIRAAWGFFARSVRVTTATCPICRPPVTPDEPESARSSSQNLQVATESARSEDREAAPRTEAAVTAVCDLLWEFGVYLKDSTPLARAIVSAVDASRPREPKP